MPTSPGNVIYRNLANIVSILGVLPICVLFHQDGFVFLIPLMIYNNIMDDLDGILAAKLDIKSNFGALLDNVCDAIAHTVFVMLVGMHYFQQEGNSYVSGACLAVGVLAALAIVLRVVSRLDPTSVTGTGSPTNELIRHMFFLLVLAQIFEFNPAPFLIVAFVLHTISMLVPYGMPYMIRSLADSAMAVGWINVALVVAWLLPATTPMIAACFFLTYLYSLVVGGIKCKLMQTKTAS